MRGGRGPPGAATAPSRPPPLLPPAPAPASNGQLAHFSCYGVVFCNSRLSGTPDVTVLLNHPSAIEPYALHPCIRVAPWQRERVISMVPPDGKFKVGGPHGAGQGEEDEAEGEAGP